MTDHLTDAERDALMHHVGAWKWQSMKFSEAEADFLNTVEAIVAARVQALREQIAQAWDSGVVHGRFCPSEFVTKPCLSNPYREGVGGE